MKKYSFIVLFFLAITCLAITVARSISANSKETQAVNISKIQSWLSTLNESTFDESTFLHHVAIFNDLKKPKVLELISSFQERSLDQKQMLMGVLARHKNFDKIFSSCLESSSDIEKAICISAYREWTGQRSEAFSAKTKEIAIELLNSDDPHARQMIAVTLASMDYYTSEIFEQIMAILKQELSNHNKNKSTVYSMSLQILESMTNTTTSHLNNLEIVFHFEKWLKNNHQRLEPSVTHYDEKKLNYINTLHRFSLKLPSSYQPVRELKYIQGKLCFFADEYGRSLSVETYPKRQSLKLAFAEVKENSKVIKQEKIIVNNYPAIKYTVDVPNGIFIGLLIQLNDRLILTTVYSPVESDSLEDVERLLNSLSII